MIILICIPFYYFNSKDRSTLSNKIFYHYYLIKNEIKKNYNVDIEFILIGEADKTFILKYFHEKEYYEYKQNLPKNKKEMVKILVDKLHYSLDIIRKKDFDIVLFSSNNDLINIDFYKKIIEKYNKNDKQIYGISKTIGNNTSGCYLFNYTNMKINSTIYFWDGNKKKTNFSGGILGMNKILFDEINNLIYKDNANEVITENIAIQHGAKVINIFTKYFNIKVLNSEISSLNSFIKLSSVKKINIKNDEYFNNMLNYFDRLDTMI